MRVTSALAAKTELPKMCRVSQKLDGDFLDEEKIRESVRSELSREQIKRQIKPKMKIAVTCGSRGVANISFIIRNVIDNLKDAGAEPFIVPAMGSHGGATAEGQTEILRSYGVTEQTMGCPIRSSMEVVQIGEVKGEPVYLDKNAADADGIIVVGRIKPHTGFRGKYESGLMKMMVIGLGKQKGAEACHVDGFGAMAENIELRGKEILKKASVLCGLGIIENAREQTWKLVGLTPEEIIQKEPYYLEMAKKQMPGLPFHEIDVLVVDQIGKDISGDGMDPNITGTFCSPYASGGIHAENVVILDLTDASHGCAIGMGMADFATRRFFEKVDFDATYPNAITSKMVIQAKVPMILANDKEAIQIALRTCPGIEKHTPRIVRMKDTLHLEEFWISEGLLKEAQENLKLKVLDAPSEMQFDENGRIKG